MNDRVVRWRSAGAWQRSLRVEVHEGHEGTARRDSTRGRRGTRGARGRTCEIAHGSGMAMAGSLHGGQLACQGGRRTAFRLFGDRREVERVAKALRCVEGAGERLTNFERRQRR